jgi:alpha-galactosidase
MKRMSLIVFCACSALAQKDYPLERLDLTLASRPASPMGFPAQPGRSVAGMPLRISGREYTHGIGLHSGSRLDIRLAGDAERFAALVGMDDAKTALPKPLPGSAIPQGLLNHNGSARVEVWVDGKLAAKLDGLRRGVEPKPLEANLRGARRVAIIVSDGGRWPFNNPVDLVDAVIVGGSAPVAVAAPAASMPEVAAGHGPEPVIHPPRITGGSTGKPFLFRIPASGAGPIRIRALTLPPGLTLDEASGVLRGVPSTAGRTRVTLIAESRAGRDERTLEIVIGDRPLALTPPLGWNSWNVWARAVDDRKIRDAADQMVRSGLAAHGYAYIGIDDAWMGKRDANGEIQTDGAKFPDMKGLAEYVHSLGLKIGIYSSPGPQTCQRLEGSHGHEAQDAATYARWGFDLLKYDLCSYGALLGKNPSREDEIRPYRIMGDALRSGPRDIVYSLCQYGRANVGEWAPEVGGQMWRTTGDIRDSWESMSEIGFGQAGHERWAGPGRWNDTDMMVLGQVGWGVEMHKSRLTPDEEMTHVGLWTLLAAPILLGCDLGQLDPFTLSLLTNDEVLEVHQDVLGKQGARMWQDGLLEAWARPLANGDVALGVFNRGIEEATAAIPLEAGAWRIRDLWAGKEAGQARGTLTTRVRPHGMKFYRLSRKG